MKDSVLARGVGLAALALCCALAACATEPVARQHPATLVPRTTKIVLAAPIIEYRDINNGAALNVPQEDHNRICRALTTAVLDEAARKGIEVSGVGGAAAICDPSPDCNELFRISRMRKTDRAEHEKQALADFLKDVNGSQVLFLRSRFYIGPGGFWNPINGAIASAGSRMVLDAHLFSSDMDTPLWQQTVQVRVSPGEGGDHFRETVKLLLETLQPN